MRKNNNIIILITTIIISLMLIIFTVMIVFMQNTYKHTSDNTTSNNTTSYNTASYSIASDNDNAAGNTETAGKSAEQEEIKETDNTDLQNSEAQLNIDEESKLFYAEDRINLAVDDKASHDVEYENEYSDTLKLLPSVYYEHQPVPKNKVSTDNFSKSYAGKEISSIIFANSGEDGVEESVSVPSEITLYNVDNERANSYDITATITGANSLIKSMGWSTSDSSKLELTKTSGNTTTVVKRADFTGDMEIRLVVTYDTGDGMTSTEHLKIMVHVKNMKNKSKKLYDIDGNELYVDKEGKKPAYLKDYAHYDTFYGSLLITGWQRIKGKRYYFDESGWAVRGEQIIGGIKYTFNKKGVLVDGGIQKGIDVSLYQRHIDWEKVAAAGIDFAIIRCGFRGCISGRLAEDSCFKRNIEGAKKAGIKVGVYFFTQALNEKEAEEEAHMVLSLCEGYTLELPVFIDSENAVNGRANGLDRERRTKVTKKFCDTILKNGYEAGVYASKCWYYSKLNTAELEKYCIWVAQYNTECDYTGKAEYWQYSSRGHIDGIEGNVDLNVSVLQKPAIP